MINNIKISYDPNGSGDTYGIRVKGNLETFLKLFKRMVVEKEMMFPLDSHHGTDFVLEDYGVTLAIAMRDWTHDNKGNGIGHPMFILKQSKYVTIINEHGRSDHRNIGISMSMKKGFKKMLENCGFTYADSFNDKHDGESVSVIAAEKIIFDSKTWEKSLKVFLVKLQDMIETLDAVS